jgi:hypothetical protein
MSVAEVSSHNRLSALIDEPDADSLDKVVSYADDPVFSGHEFPNEHSDLRDSLYKTATWSYT